MNNTLRSLRRPGPLLILAGAGSGKTRTLTYRVAYLLSKGVDPKDILLLTFTNKAAKEMLSRVEDLTGYEPRRFWGGTFHSIGHRLLRTTRDTVGLAKNFTILDAGEAETVLKHAVEAVDKTFSKNKTHPKPGPLSSIISMAATPAHQSRKPSPTIITAPRASQKTSNRSPRPTKAGNRSRKSSITTIY